MAKRVLNLKVRFSKRMKWLDLCKLLKMGDGI